MSRLAGMRDLERYSTDGPRLNGGLIFGFLAVLGATVLAFMFIEQFASQPADSARITYLNEEQPWQKPVAANAVSGDPSKRSSAPEG